jgi:hypothetical protein
MKDSSFATLVYNFQGRCCCWQLCESRDCYDATILARRLEQLLVVVWPFSYGIFHLYEEADFVIILPFGIKKERKKKLVWRV